jgi:outer membrane immunogenic protein
VKGGAAWVHDRWNLTNAVFDISATPVVQNTRSGWTVGAGVEWAFAPSWSAFVEYDFYGFRSRSVTTFVDDDDFNSLDVKQGIHTVKLGVNYRFGGWLGKGPVTARY